MVIEENDMFTGGFAGVNRKGSNGCGKRKRYTYGHTKEP